MAERLGPFVFSKRKLNELVGAFYSTTNIYAMECADETYWRQSIDRRIAQDGYIGTDTSAIYHGDAHAPMHREPHECDDCTGLYDDRV